MEGMDRTGLMEGEGGNASTAEWSNDSREAKSLHPRSSPTVGKPKSELHLKRGDPDVDGPKENLETPERMEAVSPDNA